MNDTVIIKDLNAPNFRTEFVQNIQEQFGMVDHCTQDEATRYDLSDAISLIRLVNERSGGERSLSYEFV